MRFEQPKDGTVIWKRKFAFFPKRIGATTIWFERYYRCLNFVSRLGSFGISPHWAYKDFLPEAPEVKAYLLSQSPLAKAMLEEE